MRLACHISPNHARSIHMKRIMAAISLVSLLNAGLLHGQGAPPASIKKQSVEQELIGLETDWNDALISGNTEALSSMMTDDYMDTDPDGRVSTKSENLYALRSGDLRFTSIVNSEYKVHIYGDAAVLNYRSSVKGRFKGSSVGGKYRMTDMWVKRDGRWKCIAAHQSKLS
jgi:ketosteroid isomerase-like protein